jgi:ribose transport system substrate-binding protein
MTARFGLLPAVLAALFLSSMRAQAQDIGAVLAGTRGPFWKVMEKGITQAATDLGVSVLIRSPVDDDPTSVEQNLQLKMVQYMLQNGAKAIILAPMPVVGVPTPIEFPVPVVFVDRPSEDFKTLSTIATDNYAGGRAAAQFLEGRLARGAKVGVLRLAPYVSSTSAREAGFIDTAKALGFEIAVDSYVGHDMREGQALASVVLSPHRGNLDAVFTPTDKIAIGAMRAFQEWLPARRPLLLSFDYRPGFESEVRDGNLHVMIVQDAYQMGYQAVERLVQLRAGRPIPPQIMVDFLVVTTQNVDDPAIRARVIHHQD